MGAARRNSVSPLVVPRQHGAWSVLLLNLALGLIVAGRFTAGSLALIVVALVALPARHAATWWLRLPRDDPRRPAVAGWVVCYGLALVAAAVPLARWDGVWALLPMAVVAGVAGGLMTALELARRDRTLVGELIGMLGLSPLAPAAYAVSAGHYDATAAGLWAMSAVVFGASVLHVRYVARGAANQRGAGLASLFTHVAAVAGALAASHAGWLPPPAALAFVPAMARAAWPVIRPPSARPAIRRLGFEELAYSVAFVVLTAWAYGV